MRDGKFPNLFVIGAMKSGTTSLHNYLNSHPAIFMCEPKEPGFFVEEIAWRRGFSWYLSLFEQARPEHRYLGESSTDYTKLPTYQGVAKRIHQFNPDARLIFVMRNPFDRMVSHYWHAVRHVSTGGLRKNIYKACLSDPQYLSYSDYPTQIKPWLELFGPDRIHFVLFEELIADQQRQMSRIHDWLELPPTPTPSVGQRAWNARPEEIKGVAGLGLLNRLAYSRPWEILSRCTPPGLKSVARQLAVTTISVDSQKKYQERLRREVHTQLAEQVDEMSAITGRDLATVWPLEHTWPHAATTRRRGSAAALLSQSHA
jgi:hypothetical protein